MGGESLQSRYLGEDKIHARRSGCFDQTFVCGRERQTELHGKSQISGVIVGETVPLRQDRQFEDVGGRLPGAINREILDAAYESGKLIPGYPLATVGHDQTITNFIEPQDGNQGTFFREAS